MFLEIYLSQLVMMSIPTEPTTTFKTVFRETLSFNSLSFWDKTFPWLDQSCRQPNKNFGPFHNKSKWILPKCFERVPISAGFTFFVTKSKSQYNNLEFLSTLFCTYTFQTFSFRFIHQIANWNIFTGTTQHFPAQSFNVNPWLQF